jgi:hypothetical protein
MEIICEKRGILGKMLYLCTQKRARLGLHEPCQRQFNKTLEDMATLKAKKKYTADDFAGMWDDEHFMAAEDINKAIRDGRHVKSSRDEFWDKFLNEP